MTYNENKIIDKDLREKLENLIEELGGLNAAARFLNIGKKTLNGYVDAGKKEIHRNVWDEKLTPILKLSRAERLNKFASELARLRRLDEQMYYLEYSVKKKQEDFEKEISEIIESPFNIYFHEFAKYGSHYEFPLIKDLEDLEKGDKVSGDKLVRHVDQFRRIYKLFRPDSISQDHPYWGTVKLMDAIFDTFESVFEISYDTKFTKYGVSWIEQLYKEKRNFDEISWNRLITDLQDIRSRIDKAIMELAINSAEYFKHAHSYFFKIFIRDYILKNYRIKNPEEFSEKNVEVGKIIIENIPIEFKNKQELDYHLSRIYKRKFDDTE